MFLIILVWKIVPEAAWEAKIFFPKNVHFSLWGNPYNFPKSHFFQVYFSSKKCAHFELILSTLMVALKNKDPHVPCYSNHGPFFKASPASLAIASMLHPWGLQNLVDLSSNRRKNSRQNSFWLLYRVNF